MKDRLKELKDQVWQRLRQVLDPELNINLVDLGLIYKVEVDWKKNQQKNPKIFIQMTLTSPGCPLAAVFEPMIRESLIGLRFAEGENDLIDIEEDVEIELTFDPPWVMDMMSEEARAELGID